MQTLLVEDGLHFLLAAPRRSAGVCVGVMDDGWAIGLGDSGVVGVYFVSPVQNVKIKSVNHTSVQMNGFI